MSDENIFYRIAKRENNLKRSYLVVNPLQGKHVAVSPKKALSIFTRLAHKIDGLYENEKILFVGFAETATAIGAQVALEKNGIYIQTTREIIEGVDYLYFSEEHSHATEQKLVKNDIDFALGFVDRIIFVEDEVTTGKTILNIINIIKKNYEKKINFSVMSILNGMTKEFLEKYESEKIDLFYLEKTDHSGFEKLVENFEDDGNYFLPDTKKTEPNIFVVDNYLNPRRLVDGKKYLESCEYLSQKIFEKIDFHREENILILGTEELMFPALFVGKKLEDMGMNVLSHSTTRSPISVSKKTDYILHNRFELVSLYDKNRRTFIYDLKSYSKVIIVTDGNCDEGIVTLINALKKYNQNIFIFRWT